MSAFQQIGASIFPSLAVDPIEGAGRVLGITVSDTAKHSDIRTRQIEIFRSMTPARRLAEGMRMNRVMRGLMAGGFRQRYPDWSDAEVSRAVADRILHARTG